MVTSVYLHTFCPTPPLWNVDNKKNINLTHESVLRFSKIERGNAGIETCI